MPLYSLIRGGEALELRTSSFRAGPRSVLHEGIHSPELISSLIAGASVVLALGAALALGVGVRRWHTLVVAMVFIAVFYVCRRYWFRPVGLRAVFDRAAGSLRVEVTGAVGSANNYSLRDIERVARGTRRFEHANPDGVAFVERIALHHHTALPGFGDPVEHNTVGIVMRDGQEVLLFAGPDAEEADELARNITEFLEIDNAQKD